MSIAFKIDEDHNGTGQEKKDEMLNKEPLPLIKKGDAAFCNTPAIRKLKQMFRSQTVLQSNSRKQMEVIRCKRRVFLLCISSKIPVYMGMFQP